MCVSMCLYICVCQCVSVCVIICIYVRINWTLSKYTYTRIKIRGAIISKTNLYLYARAHACPYIYIYI